MKNEPTPDPEKEIAAMREAIREAYLSLTNLVEHIEGCSERDLLACDSDPHPPSVFSVYGIHAKRTLAKLQPFLKLSSKATPGEWKWHWRNDDSERPGVIFAMPRAGHAYAVAMCPRYGKEHFDNDATFIARSRNISPKMAEMLLATIELMDDMPFSVADALEEKFLNLW
jgi:hypothetical protein